MYTDATLLEIKALPIDSPPSPCTLCSSGATAAWNVTIKTPSSLLSPSTTRCNVLACKKHCFPLNSNVVKAKLSTQDRFLVDQRSVRLTYAHLIDACNRNMPLVLADSRLSDIYHRISTLGQTIGKGELDYSWMRLNQHFSGEARVNVIF